MKNFLTNFFQEESYSSDLINLYDFDYDLSLHLIYYIFKIKRRLSGLIINVVMQLKNINSKNFKEGKILKLNNDDFLYIFPHLKKDKIKVFKTKITELALKNSKTLKEWNIKNKNNLKEVYNIPFYALSKFWTLSTIQTIIENTRKEIKVEIMKHYFNREDKIEQSLISSFVSSVNAIRIVRNQICHNKPIYNIEIKKDKENLRNIIKYNNIKKTKQGLFIFELCLIINYFLMIKNNNINFIDKIKRITEKYSKKFKNRNIWIKIKKYMKFN